MARTDKNEHLTMLKRLGLNQIDGADLRGVLGAGGQGVVCEFEKNGNTLAAKFLVGANDVQVARFQAEAEALNKPIPLGDKAPCVRARSAAIKVPDLPVWYFFMDKAEGESLQAVFERRPLPWSPRMAMGLLGRVASGLRSLHAAHLVHRDLHPGNITWFSRGMSPPPKACSPVLPGSPSLTLV